MNTKQLAYLVRCVLYHDNQSQVMLGDGSTVLRILAVSAGIDVKAIEKEQAEVAKKRADRVAERIGALQEQIKGGKKAKK
jgi:hypothetical protein